MTTNKPEEKSKCHPEKDSNNVCPYCKHFCLSSHHITKQDKPLPPLHTLVVGEHQGKVFSEAGMVEGKDFIVDKLLQVHLCTTGECKECDRGEFYGKSAADYDLPRGEEENRRFNEALDAKVSKIWLECDKPWEKTFRELWELSFDNNGEECMFEYKALVNFARSAIAQAVAEATRKGNRYPHMCKNGHEEIGHRSQEELCPVDKAIAEATKAERERIREGVEKMSFGTNNREGYWKGHSKAIQDILKLLS